MRSVLAQCSKQSNKIKISERFRHIRCSLKAERQRRRRSVEEKKKTPTCVTVRCGLQDWRPEYTGKHERQTQTHTHRKKVELVEKVPAHQEGDQAALAGPSSTGQGAMVGWLNGRLVGWLVYRRSDRTTQQRAESRVQGAGGRQAGKQSHEHTSKSVGGGGDDAEEGEFQDFETNYI